MKESLLFITKKNKNEKKTLIFLTKKQKNKNTIIFAFLNKKQKKTLLVLTKKQKQKNKKKSMKYRTNGETK